jgi:hypothetical protein
MSTKWKNGNGIDTGIGIPIAGLSEIGTPISNLSGS